MTQNQPDETYTHVPPSVTEQEDEHRRQHQQTGEGYKCPECGKVLEDQNHRNKHAVEHYGDDMIPPYPDRDLAAQRKGALMDVDPKTLRGFPQRRW